MPSPCGWPGCAARSRSSPPPLTAAAWWAADDWARKNGCAVAEPERIKQVSGALLAGGSLALFSEFSIGGVWPRGLHPAACAAKAQVVLSLSDTDPDGARPLHLVPRIAVLGSAAGRGTPAGQILELLSDFLARAQVSRRALCRVCSIDLKARSPGCSRPAGRWACP